MNTHAMTPHDLMSKLDAEGAPYTVTFSILGGGTVSGPVFGHTDKWVKMGANQFFNWSTITAFTVEEV